MGAQSSAGRVLENPVSRDRIGQYWPPGRDGHQIHPGRVEHIDSVKINPSLVMMREWTINDHYLTVSNHNNLSFNVHNITLFCTCSGWSIWRYMMWKVLSKFTVVLCSVCLEILRKHSMCVVDDKTNEIEWLHTHFACFLLVCILCASLGIIFKDFTRFYKVYCSTKWVSSALLETESMFAR